MQLEAIILTEDGSKRRIAGLSSRVTIGRGADCSIALESNLVSRRHLTLEIEGAVMRVCDSAALARYASMSPTGSTTIATPRPPHAMTYDAATTGSV